MEDKMKKFIQEKIELDINIGDEILAGRFKNKKVIVKDIGKDEQNQPTINGKTILKFKIKKLIREEIAKIFEVLDFQTNAVENLATSSALHKLPRKGIDDSINNYNIIQTQIDKNQEEENEKLFDVPGKQHSAVVRTNIYEREGFYGATIAAQDNLDYSNNPTSIEKKANFGQNTQDEVDLYNDNIKRTLTEVPPGNSRVNATINNKSKNF
jgi:hypothetical protein